MISSAFTLKQLEALIWVADLGSFRKAAAHLNTTQPNISSRIAGLEKTLGLSLMQRDTGSVQLTAKGAEIVAQARVVLQNADTLLNIAGRPICIQIGSGSALRNWWPIHGCANLCGGCLMSFPMFPLS